MLAALATCSPTARKVFGLVWQAGRQRRGRGPAARPVAQRVRQILCETRAPPARARGGEPTYRSRRTELYVMGERRDPAAIEAAFADDEAGAPVVASEAHLETVLRDARRPRRSAQAATIWCRARAATRAAPRSGRAATRCCACSSATRTAGCTSRATRMAEQVALKELAFVQSPTLSAIAAFEREAKLLRALEHPAIPRFVASFEEGAGVHALLPGAGAGDGRVARGPARGPLVRRGGDRRHRAPGARRAGLSAEACRRW